MDKALDLLYSKASDEEVQSFCLINADGLQCQDNLRLNLFHHLIIANRASLISLLLTKFSSDLITQQDLCGKTPAHFLAEKGNYYVLDSVLQINKNIINISDDSGRTIWHSCFRYPNIIEIQKTMMKYCQKDDILKQNKFGVSIKDLWIKFYKEFQEHIWSNALNGNFENLIDTRHWFKEMLNEDLEIMKEIGHSLLTEIALNAEFQIFEKYLEITKVPLDFVDSSGRCVVTHILSSNLRDIFQRINILLKCKNSFAICDFEASTPIHFLIKNKNIEISEKLELMDLFDIHDSEKLKKMLKIVDFSGDCALTLAIKLKDTRFTKTVIAFYKKLYNSYDMFPKSGLPYFFEETNWKPYFYKDENFDEIYSGCKLLTFKNRVDNRSIFWNLSWKFPVHPLEAAIEAGTDEIFDFLLEKGFKINSFGSRGQALLEDAVKSNNLRIIKSAIDREKIFFYHAEMCGEEGKDIFAYYDNESESKYSEITSIFFIISKTTNQQIVESLFDAFISSISESDRICKGSLEKIEYCFSKTKNIINKREQNIIAHLVKENTIGLLLDYIGSVVDKSSFEKSWIYYCSFIYSIYYGNYEIFEKIIIKAFNIGINIFSNNMFKENQEILNFVKFSGQLTLYNNENLANFCLTTLLISPNPSKEIAERLIKMNIQWEGEFPIKLILRMKPQNGKTLKDRLKNNKNLCEVISIIVKYVREANYQTLSNYNINEALDLAICIGNEELFCCIFDIFYSEFSSSSDFNKKEISQVWLRYILTHNLVNALEKMLEIIIINSFSFSLRVILKYYDLSHPKLSIESYKCLFTNFNKEKCMEDKPLLRRIEKCSRNRPLIYSLCYDECYFDLIQEIIPKLSSTIKWGEQEKANPLLKACKYGQVKIVNFLLNQMPCIPSNVLAKAINLVSLFVFKDRHPVNIDIWKYEEQELLKRQAIIESIVNYSIESGLIDRSRPKFLENRIYNGVLLSTSATMSASAIEFLLEKGFHPEDYFDVSVNWNSKIRKSFPKQKIYRQYPLKECLLHNNSENAAIVLINHLNLKEIDINLHQSCLFVASKRSWWDAFFCLLINIKNSSYWRAIIWNIIKANQISCLKKFIELRKEQIINKEENNMWAINIDEILYDLVHEKNPEAANLLLLNKNIFKIKCLERICYVLERKESFPINLNIAAFTGDYPAIINSLKESMKIDPKSILSKYYYEIREYATSLSSNERLIYQDALFYSFLRVSFKLEHLTLALPNFLPLQIQEAKKIPFQTLIRKTENSKIKNSEVLKILLYNYIELNIDTLIIGAFYGNKKIISYIKAHPNQISENALEILLAAVNGFIYRFSPNFNSFYETSSNIMIANLSQYKEKDKKLHKEFLDFIAEKLLTKSINPTSINKIKVIHILYVCLHFRLFTLAASLYSKFSDLGVSLAIFQGILSECARNGHIEILRRLIDMGIDPNLSYTIPAWEILPRYYNYNAEHDEILKIWKTPTSNNYFIAAYPTAMHWAVEQRNENLIDLLLPYCSNIYIQAPLKFIKHEIHDEILVTASDLAKLNQFNSIYQKINKNSGDFINIGKRYRYPSEFKKYFIIGRKNLPNWLMMLLSAIWTGNNDLLIYFFISEKYSINFHSLINGFENEKIVEEIYNGAILLNNLCGIKILKACKFVPPYSSVKLSAGLGRDEITIELLEIFGINNSLFKEAYQKNIQSYQNEINILEDLYKDKQYPVLSISQISEIAQLALLSFSKHAVELLLAIYPGSFTIETFESVFSINYSGLDIWALIFLKQSNSINNEQIENLLNKLKKNISEEEIISLLLEFSQRKLITQSFLEEFIHDIKIADKKKILCKWYNIPITLEVSLKVLKLRNETNSLMNELSLALLNEEEIVSLDNTLNAYDGIHYMKKGNEIIKNEMEKYNISIDHLDSSLKRFLSHINRHHHKVFIKVTMDYQSIPKSVYPLVMRALRVSKFKHHYKEFSESHGLNNKDFGKNEDLLGVYKYDFIEPILIENKKDEVLTESSSIDLINFLVGINRYIKEQISYYKKVKKICSRLSSDIADKELLLVYVDPLEFNSQAPSPNTIHFTLKDDKITINPQKCTLYDNLKLKAILCGFMELNEFFVPISDKVIEFDIDILTNEIIPLLSSLECNKFKALRKFLKDSSFVYWLVNVMQIINQYSYILKDLEKILITFTIEDANYDNSKMQEIDRITILDRIKFEKTPEYLLVTFKMLKHSLCEKRAEVSENPQNLEKIKTLFLTSMMESGDLIEELIKISVFTENQKDLKNKIIENANSNINFEWNFDNFNRVIEEFARIIYKEDENLSTKTANLKTLEWIGCQIHSESVFMEFKNAILLESSYYDKSNAIFSSDSDFILGSKSNKLKLNPSKCPFEEIRNKYLLNISPRKILEICHKDDILLINCSEIITISQISCNGYINGNNNSYFINSINQIFKVCPKFPTEKELAYSVGSLFYCADDGTILYDKQNPNPNFENSVFELENLCEVNFSELYSKIPKVISIGFSDDLCNINLKMSQDFFIIPICNKPKYSIKSRVLGSREYKDLIDDLNASFEILRKKAELKLWEIPIYVDFEEANNNEAFSQDKQNSDAIFYLLKATLDSLIMGMTDIILYEGISFDFNHFEPELLWIKNPISYKLAMLFRQSIKEVSIVFINGIDKIEVENKKLSIYIPITKSLEDYEKISIKDAIIASLIEEVMNNIPKNITLLSTPSKLSDLVLLSQIDRIYNQFYLLSHSILNLDLEISINHFNEDKLYSPFIYSISDKLKVELICSRSVKIPSISEICDEIRKQRKLPMISFKLIPINDDSILFASKRKLSYVNQFQNVSNLEAKIINLGTFESLSLDLKQEKNFIYIKDLIFENAWALIVFLHKDLPIGFKIVAVGPNMPEEISKFYDIEKRKLNEFGIIIYDAVQKINPSRFPQIYPNNPSSENLAFVKKDCIISKDLLMDALCPIAKFPALQIKSAKIYDVTLLSLQIKNEGKITVYFKSSCGSAIKPAVDLCLEPHELLSNYYLSLFTDGQDYILESFYYNLTLQTSLIPNQTDFIESCFNKYFSNITSWHEKPYIIFEIINTITSTRYKNIFEDLSRKTCVLTLREIGPQQLYFIMEDNESYFLAKVYLYSILESNKITPKISKQLCLPKSSMIKNQPFVKDLINYIFELENCSKEERNLKKRVWKNWEKIHWWL